MEIDQLVKTMQASIAPCLLISGFGFLLLTMTNRLGRATDRVRMLNDTARKAAGAEDKRNLCEQIGIIYRRCRLLQFSIGFITFSIFCVAVNVLLLFSTYTFQFNTYNLIRFFFGLSLISLICSLFIFMIDIVITLRSLKIELRKHL